MAAGRVGARARRLGGRLARRPAGGDGEGLRDDAHGPDRLLARALPPAPRHRDGDARAAVLELVFRGLGAEVARSGAIDGNAASLRVSEKLGYRAVGRSTLAPQGVEVGHTDLELRREDWRPPIPVEIDGLEPCLALFGV